jgi:hypothetical protein
MDERKFLEILDETRKDLLQTAIVTGFKSASDFEKAVRETIGKKFQNVGTKLDPHPHPHAFPDISIGRFGVEVKFSEKDSWRNVANSISEGVRDRSVEKIFVIYCKMGGTPDIRVRPYEDVVMHVRTSHVPRFELDMETVDNIFKKFGVTYTDFASLDMNDKMKFVRQYARERLLKGERLWWLDGGESSPHTLPTQVRLYMNLSQTEKRKLRAESAVLCPQIAKGSRAKHKYDDVALYLLTYHGVLVPQVRDLFSAGSVALRGDAARGGNYILRALQDLEPELLKALSSIEDKLIIEYWGEYVPPGKRQAVWLQKLDDFADGWVPSQNLFSETGQ